MVHIQQLSEFGVDLKVFSLQQAEEILLVISRFTLESDRKVKDLKHRILSLPAGNSDLKEELQKQIQNEVDKWQDKVEKLGVYPKGVWMADFDNGSGYFCWRYPEKKIEFQHGYKDGFSKRTKTNSSVRLNLEIDTI